MTICRYINSSQSNFEFEYISELETEFKTIIEYESGAQVGSIGRKKQRAKISCYCPFNRAGRKISTAFCQDHILVMETRL
jgi:hypothetical protein